MRPPTAPDRCACDHVSKARNTGPRGLNSYSPFLYPSYRLFCRHDHSLRTEPLNVRYGRSATRAPIRNGEARRLLAPAQFIRLVPIYWSYVFANGILAAVRSAFSEPGEPTAPSRAMVVSPRETEICPQA